ncbi:Protein C26G2.2 [Aphelenchoides avenae]|nr:Protein C26G2.2 [Aphelenchus avenae]
MSGRFPVINCRHFLPTFLLAVSVVILQPLPTIARRRWRRQALPYDNLQVHSMDSNVTIAGDVHVVSMESRIDFRELHFNASVWSNSSSLHFDPSSDSFALTAAGTALESRLNDALVQSSAASAPTQCIDPSRSVADSSGLRIEAANGRAAHLMAESRQTNAQRKINASVANSDAGERQLRITFESGTYFAQVEILHADVGIFYGPVRIQISADYRRVVLLSGLYRIEILTATSPFSIIVTDQELNITSPNEQLDVRLRPNSTDVLIDAGMTSRLAMNRSADSVVNVRGSSGSTLPVDRLEMLSRQLALQLSAAGVQNISVLATALQSNISMQMASTKMNMLAARHLVEVFGGRPQVFLDTGNISVIINVLSSADETSVTPMPPFTTPSSFRRSGISATANAELALVGQC